MNNNNIVKILIIIVILLSIGLTATSIKLVSLDKKVDNIHIPIVQEPIKEEPVVEEPVIEVPDKVIVKPKYISTEQAIEIGMNKVGIGAKLVEIKSELDDNPPKYELVIISGNHEYELEIHAITGSVIDFEKDDIHD